MTTAAAFPSLKHKDLLSVADLNRTEILTIFETAAALKAKRDEYNDVLRGKRLAMIFEKDSLRTRFTFDVGSRDMGGSAVYLDHRDARIGSREAVKDMARNLERWVDAIVARTYKHRHLEELAENCNIPVINGLTDLLHPCQALSDFFTLSERVGDVRGMRLCYIGDGNNTCHSLMHTATKLGAQITICCPEGYEPDAGVLKQSKAFALESGAEVRLLHDPNEAAEGADAIYTDVWASMGQEGEIEERACLFAGYQVGEALMAQAKKDAVFMHCLPAHRGAEVTPGVMDGPQSIVYDIAENRLHVQKALLVMLLGGGQS